MISNKPKTAIFKLILLIFFIAVIPVVLLIYYRDTLFSADWLRMNIMLVLEHHKGHAAIILLVLQIIQVIICVIPGQPIQFAASYMFGILRGYLISVAGAAMGALASFYIAKILGRDAMHLLFDMKRIDDYKRRLNSGRGLLAVMLIYLIPGMPKDLVAYAAGLSEMRVRPFILVSTLARSPAMLGSLMLGHFWGRSNYRAIIILSVATVILVATLLIQREWLIRLLDSIEEMDVIREERKLGQETEDR